VETSLHRQLKELYAGQAGRLEVALEGYRIDAIAGDELIEIQHASLAAIRPKIRRLLERHRVRVVKPLVVEKTLVFLDQKQKVVRRRRSPKRGQLLDLFDELVYFTQVFPHPQLTLEFPLIELEETRQPGHGKRRRWRRNDHTVVDQKLVAVRGVEQIATADDLWQWLPGRLPKTFHTGHLADQLKVARHIAQRVAYCLRQTGAAIQVGKARNALLYERAANKSRAA
jgi:hypothetical protein